MDAQSANLLSFMAIARHSIRALGHANVSTKMNEQRSTTEVALLRTLSCSVVILAGIGIAAAIARAISIATAGLVEEQIRHMLPVTFAQDAYVIERWFAAYPVLTLLHIVPGA